MKVFWGLLLLALVNFSRAEGCKGCVNLDESNFNKIISRFKAVAVKFDVAYPYGDKHEVFSKVAKDIVSLEDLIFAEVGVKDYGEKDNEQLAKKYGFKSKDDLPGIRLFVEGHEEPFSFNKDEDWNEETVKKFIRDNTDLYIGLSGCLEQFDKLALEFSQTSDKTQVLKKTETEAKSLEKEDEKTIAQVYIKLMTKIIDNGMGFVKQEVSRLKKLMSEAKITEKKKQELQNRINILKSFKVNEKTEL